MIIQRFLNQKKKMSCSFFEIVGSVCGVDERSRSHTTSVIPLSLCDKDIKSHMKSLQFSGVSTEADLILARCGIFERTESFSKMTICPFHRSSLGIGWRRTSKLCCVPRTASSHSKETDKAPQAERGINLVNSMKLLELTKELIPVGSGN